MAADDATAREITNMIEELKNLSYNGDGPVTKREFAEALQMIANAFEQTATKNDLKAVEQRLGNKLDSWGQKILDHIDAAVENRQLDLGAAKSENVETNTERLGRHEKRITDLEKHADIAT